MALPWLRALAGMRMSDHDPYREAIKRLLEFVPGSETHDTGCPLSVMHDDFYENPDDDEHPIYPRACDCHVEAVRFARGLLER